MTPKPNATEHQTERQNTRKTYKKGQKHAGVRCSQKTRRALFMNEQTMESIVVDFTTWLRVLGYSLRSVQAYQLHTLEILEFCKKSKSQINPQVLKNYMEYTQARPNQRRSGGLSSATLVLKFRVLKLLVTYLALMKDFYINISIPLLEASQNIRLPLTKIQTQQLYQVIDKSKDRLQDRVIMCLYYGCGLRRSEGLRVELKDLLLTQKLLYVQKGKWGKSRYIPLTISQVKDLKNYIHYQRPKSSSSRLLLNKKGEPISGSGLAYRLKKWKQKTDIKQQVCLHVLRHSIATHLLHNGMSLQWVSRFLGHSSLVATQRYTHL